MDYNTSNPVFRDNVFGVQDTDAAAMTVNGVIKKSFLTLFLLLAGAAFAWTRSYASIAEIGGKVLLFSIGAFVVYLVTIFNPKIARITVPLYALAEGFVIGGVSLIFQKHYPGIVVQAAAGTLGVFGAMLVVYRTGLIRPTEKFATIIFVATLGIAFIYLANFLMQSFGSSGLSIVSSSSPLSIGFSVFVCAIAALHLLLDFEFIVRQSRLGAPEKLEWIATLGLLVTLVWIYVEILHLLAKIKDR
ncbi:MAG: Bax inhibitor-1/YccA family protein [Puniceicoccales bacterium]|jgi:uncharacterized YccA/Bax inhibitor family protein|nr:Bax inhibitor-1/YccA family protein [Puniceicoccales bacterium]